MSRIAIIGLGMLLLASAAVAQEPPPPPPPDTLPEMLPEATAPVTEPAPAATPEVSPPALSIEATEALPVVVSARNDLELLADQALSAGQRPAGWSGSIDVGNPDLPLLVRLDLEVLAGAVLGSDVRPDGWFGVVASSPLAVARDIRHDLELLADIVVGAPTLRPGNWVGDDPIMRCSRATQALVPLLERGGFVLNVDFTQPTYCQEIEVQASRWVETQIIQPPLSGSVESSAPNLAGIAQPYVTETPFVVAFYDTSARRRAGVLPVGVGFRAISRSAVDFSNMMLIEGEGFRVFVDYTTTPVSHADFAALPEVSLGASTDCSAEWCSQ